MTNFSYKDCKVELTESKDHWVIRIHNKFGFRWFQTSGKEGKFLKIGQAYKIEKDIIENPISKYAFITPIIL